MQKSSRLQKTACSAIISHQARVVLRRVDLDLARDVFPSYPGAALVYSRLEERAKRRGGYQYVCLPVLYCCMKIKYMGGCFILQNRHS